MKAVFYGRKSNDDKGELGASIEQQKEWAATVPDVTIVKEFSDQSISGNDVTRPGLLAMIAFCEQQKKAGTPVEVIVCWKPNRFSRANMAKTLVFISRLQDAGVDLMLTSEGLIDFNDDSNLLVFAIQQQVQSHAYLKQCSTDTKRGKKKAAEKGQWNGGTPPFGYKLANKRLEIDPIAAESVRLIFELYRDGMGVKSIGNELLKRGIKSPKGGVWSIASLMVVLRNPVYLGKIVHHKKSEAKSIGSVRVKTEKRYIEHPRESWIVTENAHEPIVTPELFDAVQRRMKGNTKRTANLDTGFLLTGLLRCGNCGRTMSGRTFKNKKNARHYVCSGYTNLGRTLSGCANNAIPEQALFNAVLAKLNVEFDPAKLREHLASQIQPERTPDASARLPELDAKIAKATARLMTLDDAIFDEFSAMLVALKKEREELVKELAAKVPAVPAEEQIERCLKMASDFGRALKSGDSAVAKALLAQMIDRIELFFEPSVAGERRKTAFAKGWIYVTGLSTPTSVALEASDIGVSGKQAELKARRELVRKLRSEKRTVRSIAKELGLSLSAVKKDLRADASRLRA
jgi:site-specific DNA recombinase